ncbi:hypothetical protein DFO77_1029 [Marinilabilia salmonicolor]|uniref:Uncharacterized protein n=1 Tax=Marinilabilia salmonicolor TaxID=989 RepID=A0A368VF48_9BACT|nr:hypothetical protein DFO77_1029 [Marinilabilia salmonicolor]
MQVFCIPILNKNCNKFKEIPVDLRKSQFPSPDNGLGKNFYFYITGEAKDLPFSNTNKA